MTRPLLLTWPSLRSDHAAERQSFGRQPDQDGAECLDRVDERAAMMSDFAAGSVGRY